MPRARRPLPGRQIPGNERRPPANYPAYALATTVLPHTLIPVTPPAKLPPRPISGHPLGTVLTVPTVGPLPTVTKSHHTGSPPQFSGPPRLVGNGPPFVPGRPRPGNHIIIGAPGARVRPVGNGRAPIRRR